MMNTPVQSPSYPMAFQVRSCMDSNFQVSRRELTTLLESPAFSSLDIDQTTKVKREKRKYRCRKRSPATIERAKVIRRDKANARERRRMNNLNDALEHLRTLLPQLPDEPKMTKIETLRVAQGYITFLSSILAEENKEDDSIRIISHFSHLPQFEYESLHGSPVYPPLNFTK